MISPPFAVATAVVTLFGRRGIISYQVFGLELNMYGLPGLVLVIAMTFAPLAYMNIRGMLESLDPSLFEASAALGGVAGSVGQLGQRIGAAVGTAVALSLFYAAIFRESGTHDDLVVYHDAYAFGMLSVGVFVALAFLVSIVDLSARRRSRS